MERFAAGGGVCGFTFASGSPDTSSDGRRKGCPWVGCVFPDRGCRCGWGLPRMPDLLEGPFDVRQDRSTSGTSPWVLDGMQGCQYRMTSYDQESGGPNFSPAYGIQLHDPRILEYVGAPESARPLSRSPEYWLHHLGHEKTRVAALQLQHDAGLILSNVQVLQQFVTSLNRTSSEVMRVAFGRGRLRRMPCSMWYRRAMFVGWPITWRPWDCGGHLVLIGFWDPCRQQHAMPVCRAVTTFLIYHSDSI